MSNFTFYDIMYIVAAVSLYSIVLATGYIWTVIRYRRVQRLAVSLKEVVSDIKHILAEEKNSKK